jgi:hypothetical protein
MRIRSVKPEFWGHEIMANLSPEVRLLALALLNYADDEGYFLASPVSIRGAVFPFVDDSTKIRGWLLELSKIGYVVLGNLADGRAVGFIPNFRKHQRVDKPQASKLKGSARFQDDSKIVPGTFDEGMEGKGMDQGREGSTRPPARGAPASLEEAQAWAVSYSKGNSSGKEIAPAVVEKWWNHRQAVGWVNAREVPIVDWRADLTVWALNELPPRPGSPLGSAANSPQKKEGAEKPTWDWKLLALKALDWSPVGSWEDQTARSRREIREAYAALTHEQQAAFALPAKTEVAA